MRFGPTASALLACAGCACAQIYDELPAGYTQTVLQTYDHYLIPQGQSSLPVHLQYAYDVNDVPVPFAQITELAWHRNNYWNNALPAGSITVTVRLATSPLATASMSTTFAANLVNFVATVYSGTTSWPPVSTGSGPAPYTHNLVLTAPYSYIKGSNLSLVVDLVTTASTYPNSTYTMAAVGPDLGAHFDNGPAQSTCKFSNGSYNLNLGYSLNGLTNNGGNFTMGYSGLLPNAAGAVSLSRFGLDRTGPYPLPIDLAAYGMVGCAWNIGLDGPWLPTTASATGSALMPTLVVPRGLGGDWFYDQAVFVDALANAAGLVVTRSSKWYVGRLTSAPANTVFRTMDTTSSPTGTLRTGYGTDLRITR